MAPPGPPWIRQCPQVPRIFYFIFVIAISKSISRNRCKIAGKLVLITDKKSYMSYRFVPKSVTLNGEMALYCVILPTLVVSGAHCVKVVYKAITKDNLRLLSRPTSAEGPSDANGINS